MVSFDFFMSRKRKELQKELDTLKSTVEQQLFKEATSIDYGVRGKELTTSPMSPFFGEKMPVEPYSTTPRPLYRMNPMQSAGVQYPASPVSIYDLYNVALASDTMTKIMTVLKKEVFRRGIVWKPKFSRVCGDCKMYSEIIIEACSYCGSANLEKPNPKQPQAFDRFIRFANDNGQTLSGVLRELEDDLNVTDNAYLLLRRRFITGRPNEYAPNGIYSNEVREILRGDPLRMRIVGNFRGRLGNKYWVCINHRTRMEDKDPNLAGVEETLNYDNTANAQPKLFPSPGYCDEEGCGLPLFEVFYASTDGGFRIMEPFIAGEVLHIKRFSPSLMYGRSLLIGLWKDLVTRLRMKQYINEFYRYFRYPRGMLVAITDNPDGFYNFWDRQLDRLKYDPWHIPALAIQKRDGRGMVDFLKFTGTFEELQYTETLVETQATMFDAFGIQEVEADKEAGISGKFLKPTPTTVEFHQSTYEEQLFPRLLEQFGITDWVLDIQPNEEEDEMKAVEVKLKHIEEAERMQAMGYTVHRNSMGKFEFSGEALEATEIGGGMGDDGGFGGEQDDTGKGRMDEIDALVKDMTDGENARDKSRDSGKGKKPPVAKKGGGQDA